MTTTLKLVRGEAVETLLLNSSGNGFNLEDDGWIPAVATPVYMGDPPPVLEVINVYLSHTSVDNLAANTQQLHDFQVVANRYINDPTQENPIWLHAKMDGETNERRALVRNIDVQFRPTFEAAGSSIPYIPCVVTIEREPYWERTTARDLPQATGLTNMVSVYDYTAAGASVGAHDIVGDVGARIRFLEVDPTTNNQTICYMGIRSANKHGANGITNFEEVWELEDGTNYTDVTDTADATASGGNKIVVSESGVDWDDGDFHKVCRVTVDNVVTAGGQDDQNGKFLWLLRGQLSNNTDTWEVQIRYGNATTPDDQWSKGNIVEYTKNEWAIREMGIRKIPNSSIQAITSSDVALIRAETFAVQLWARRTSGSTSDLELDCLAPIPVDEGFIKFERYDDSTSPAVMGQSPQGVWDAFTELASYREDDLITVFPNNFVLPPGDGRIYFVTTEGLSISSDPYAHGIDSITTISPSDSGKYYERWLSLRGVE